MRTITYFHNMIGILTEIIGNPTPMQIPLVPDKQLTAGDLPLPVAPQEWHYRQSIDYEMAKNRAILDYASRYRETLLFNIWRMGMNSIESGSKDHWTVTPKRIEALEAAAADCPRCRRGGGRGGRGGRGGGGGAAPRRAAMCRPAAALRRHGARDSRRAVRHGPARSRNCAIRAATSFRPIRPISRPPREFVNSLLKNGITVHRRRPPRSRWPARTIPRGRTW